MLDFIILIQEKLEKWFSSLSPVKKKVVCVSACLFGIVLVSVGSEVVWYFQNADYLAHMESQGKSFWTILLEKRYPHLFTAVTTIGGMAVFAYILTRKEASEDEISVDKSEPKTTGENSQSSVKKN